MRIEHQFALALHVIKHSHFLVAHDREPLFLERMEPAHEDVGLNTALEVASAQRHVVDVAIEICAAVARHPGGGLLEQIENGRDIMGSKAPKYVLFGAQFPKIQP